MLESTDLKLAAGYSKNVYSQNDDRNKQKWTKIEQEK